MVSSILKVLFLVCCVSSSLADRTLSRDLTRYRATRIIGGTQVPVGKYPFFAAVISDTYGQFCGGALIDDQFVVTAAHCFDDYDLDAKTDLFVALGRVDLQSDAGQAIGVESIFVHPEWQRETGENDIALVKIQEKPTLDGNVAVAKLYTSSSLGDSTITAGWGLTQSENVNSASRYLLEVDVPVVDTSTCQETTTLAITSSMFCTGGVGGEGVCGGDSGGALFQADGDSWQVIGLTSGSLGLGCAQQGQYTVNTRISSYIQWTSETIAANGSEMLKPTIWVLLVTSLYLLAILI